MRYVACNGAYRNVPVCETAFSQKKTTATYRAARTYWLCKHAVCLRGRIFCVGSGGVTHLLRLPAMGWDSRRCMTLYTAWF